MLSGTVYRAPRRDGHGDAIAEDGTVIRIGAEGTEVGEISGLILGGQSVAQVRTRGDVVSTEGLIGAPMYSVITLRHGDTIVLDDGRRLNVNGPMIWGRAHSLTGTPARYAWWAVTSHHN